MNTPLTNVLSPAVRQAIYLGYALVGLVLGAVQVGLSAAQLGQPTWLTVTLAVFAFVGTALGATAASNTRTAGAPSPAAVSPGVTAPAG